MVFISNSYIVTFCPKALNYRIFKENFEIENYFRVLEDKDIYTLCKFRTTNHKLPIETGRGIILTVSIEYVQNVTI
jgi:hypothetical protein